MPALFSWGKVFLMITPSANFFPSISRAHCFAIFMEIKSNSPSLVSLQSNGLIFVIFNDGLVEIIHTFPCRMLDRPVVRIALVGDGFAKIKKLSTQNKVRKRREVYVAPPLFALQSYDFQKTFST